jgi:hypothetical protein
MQRKSLIHSTLFDHAWEKCEGIVQVYDTNETLINGDLP